MDLQLVKKGFDYTQKRRKWILLLAALGLTGYGVCKVYHSPSMVKKRKKLLKLLGVLISVAEAVSDSAEAIGVVSKDLKEFVQSDSDKIPNSLRQISKITLSEEFSESVVRVTSALTVGILRGYGSESRKDDGMSANSSFLDQVLDKLFSTSGSGFASTVVGSFARNMVVAFYSDAEPSWGSNAKSSTSLDHNDSELNSAPKWVNAICDEKFRELIGDCIQQFVSTAVAVYLDKTMNVNPYDELFSGLTNPKHERKMKDMLGSICNGGLETLIKTSNQVLTGANSNSSYSYSAIDDFGSRTTFNEELLGQEPPSTDPKARKSFYENEDHGWVNKMSSTLAVPSNRKLVLDLSGRVTFETVRSFLEFLLEKLWDGMRSSLNVVHEIVVDRGLEVVRYKKVLLGLYSVGGYQYYNKIHGTRIRLIISNSCIITWLRWWKGRFKFLLGQVRAFGMLAGGTSITPMMRRQHLMRQRRRERRSCELQPDAGAHNIGTIHSKFILNQLFERLGSKAVVCKHKRTKSGKEDWVVLPYLMFSFPLRIEDIFSLSGGIDCRKRLLHSLALVFGCIIASSSCQIGRSQMQKYFEEAAQVLKLDS
ncbi:unnamed protein product [Camellia sinensis]